MSTSLQHHYHQNLHLLFTYYKSLADRTIDQLSTLDELYYSPSKESNNIYLIMRHLAGNMKSRFTDFLTTDGEKTWRNRDDEFVIYKESREQIMTRWEDGWQCLFNALTETSSVDLMDIVYIRNEGQTIMQALHRQLAHYAYHVGQIVYIGKLIKDEQWSTLTIAKNNSAQFNEEKFNRDKRNTFFTN